MHSIEQLKKHVEAARSRKLAAEQSLSDAEAALHAAQCAAFGIAVWDIVCATGFQYAGKVYRVYSIDRFSENRDGTLQRPWVSGNPMRADGTFGTSVKNLYDDWEKLPADQPEAAL